MIPRHCRPPGRVKNCIQAQLLPQCSRRQLHASQCVAAANIPTRPSTGGQTRRAAAANAAREIQNLPTSNRHTLDLRSQGAKVPPQGGAGQHSSFRQVGIRGGRVIGKMVRSDREPGERQPAGGVARRRPGGDQVTNQPSPRDAPFKFGPRKVDLTDGPGDSNFKHRSRPAAMSDPDEYDEDTYEGRQIVDPDAEDIDVDDVVGDRELQMANKNELDIDDDALLDRFLEEQDIGGLDEETRGQLKAALASAGKRAEVDNDGMAVDFFNELPTKEARKKEEKRALAVEQGKRIEKYDFENPNDDPDETDKEPWLTEEEQEEAMNEDHWVRLETATMEPVPEALPTFTPAEVSIASLLKGRAALPIGTGGTQQMVDLQMQLATKRTDPDSINYDWAQERFTRGELVAFQSKEEMDWALHRRNWEAKAKKVIAGQPVAFRNAAEREAVSKLVTENIIKDVQKRHDGISIRTREDLQQDGVNLEYHEEKALERLDLYAKEGRLPKDPEQAVIMRELLNIPAMSAEEKAKLDEKYPPFVPVDAKTRDSIMGKMVAGNYTKSKEKGLLAEVKRITFNNGSCLPSQEKSILNKIRSYMPQAKGPA